MKDRKKMSSTITTAPVTQVILVGTKVAKRPRVESATDQLQEARSSSSSSWLEFGRLQHSVGQRVGPAWPSARPVATGRSTPATASTVASSSRLSTWRAYGGTGMPQRGQPRGADRRREAGPGRAGLGCLARLHVEAGHSLTSSPTRLLDPTAVRRRIAELGLRPTKQRGQNFVTDANTVRRIVAASGVGADDIVLEIGPGSDR